jgi:hypothetical protein
MAVRQTMERRYGAIDALNAAWGTDLWSQTYQSSSFIPRTDLAPPVAAAAWTEFASDSCDFVRRQADIRPVPPHGRYGRYRSMPWTMGKCRALDIVQFNPSQPHENLWRRRSGRPSAREGAAVLEYRGQTCWNGSVTANGYKEPGFCRVNGWLPIALGGAISLIWRSLGNQVDA